MFDNKEEKYDDRVFSFR